MTTPRESHSFNGIHARTGSYLLPALSADELYRAAMGQRIDAAHQQELRNRLHATEADFGAKEGVDVRALDEAGWAVIFPYVAPGSREARQQDAIYEALQPLLALRRTQAGRQRESRYRELRNAQGYRPGESKQRFLGRLEVGPGPADPDKLPYYLLLVASPQQIPFSIQYQLDVQYAVGRLDFDSVQEYANYAQSVVAAETRELRLSRELVLFGVANSDDDATTRSTKNLITPLGAQLQKDAALKSWSIKSHVGQQATKAQLGSLLGGAQTPALLFTASHGVGFDKGDPLRLRHQGALLCQDWPGPRAWRGPIDEKHYFSADDLNSDARLLGTIAFNFACYGAGTPELDDFYRQAQKDRPPAIADKAFVSALHRRLLSHEKGGALATIGHVDRAWACSFEWGGVGRKTGSNAQLAVFESMIKRLLTGYPVGAAMEFFNQRYAELASDLTAAQDDFADPDPFAMAELWTSHNDARGYSIAGDPAVRLQVAAESGRVRGREEFDVAATALTPMTTREAAPIVEVRTTLAVEPARACASTRLASGEPAAEKIADGEQDAVLLDLHRDIVRVVGSRLDAISAGSDCTVEVIIRRDKPRV